MNPRLGALAVGLWLSGVVGVRARTVEHPTAGLRLEIPGSWLDRPDGRRLVVESPDRRLVGVFWLPTGPGLGDREAVLARLGLVETGRGMVPLRLEPDLAPGRAALAAELTSVLDGPRLGRTWLSGRSPAGLQVLGQATASGRPVAFEAGLLVAARPVVYVFHADAPLLHLRLTQIGELVASLRVDAAGATPPVGGRPAGLAARITRLRERAGLDP